LQYGRNASDFPRVPSTEMRMALKREREAENWEDMLSRSLSALLDVSTTRWLDVHHYLWQAAENSGATRLQSLVRGVLSARLAEDGAWPQDSFDDDTPVASADTRRWLQRELISRPASSVTETESAPAETSAITQLLPEHRS
jgi:type VI secretion system protein ImpA